MILFGICLIALTLFGVYYSIPKRARQAFGSPSTQLSQFNQLYLSILLVLQESDLTQPRDPMGIPRRFSIQFGEPAYLVLQRLEDEGLVTNPEALSIYLQYSGLDTSIQAGDYKLSPSMSAIEIARRLQDPTPTHIDFVVLPGWRLEEIAAALPTSGLDISSEDFLDAARNPSNQNAFPLQMPPGSSYEGFLNPGAYHLPRSITTVELIQTLLDGFAANLAPNLQQGFNRQGLDEYQAVILASIVEREAVTADEMPLIASVFYNRLRAGMKLDSDPTVQYAIGYNPIQDTWWTNPLSLEDLKVNSPYNTYLYPDLPPGPIANPGPEALNAVAFPDESVYFYFRADCTSSGRHVFAQTFEEHVNNACP